MHQHGYIGRKMRLPKLKEKPAIVIAAFGSSNRAKVALEIFRERVKTEFSKYEVFWAYTSEILRKKLNLPSLQETLSQVEAAGFRKAVVQPLHIFPGTEFQHMAETCEFFPGMRVFLSETLLHRWDFVRDVLDVVEGDFLTPNQGLNILAIHGTPLTSDPVNIVYLGLERLVQDLYPNVLAVSVEGIPDHEAVFAMMKRKRMVDEFKKVKIIPMMYLAGLHAEEDLMGIENSWKAEMEGLGFSVECSMVNQEDSISFKGLAYFPKIIDFFIERLHRTLKLSSLY